MLPIFNELDNKFSFTSSTLRKKNINFRKFAGYATWLSIDNIEYFYSDAKGDKAKAVEWVF